MDDAGGLADRRRLRDVEGHDALPDGAESVGAGAAGVEAAGHHDEAELVGPDGEGQTEATVAAANEHQPLGPAPSSSSPQGRARRRHHSARFRSHH